jgi:hypothetical protein
MDARCSAPCVILGQRGVNPLERDGQRYLRDVLRRLPEHLNSRLDELLPHRWVPAAG